MKFTKKIRIPLARRALFGACALPLLFTAPAAAASPDALQAKAPAGSNVLLGGLDDD